MARPRIKMIVVVETIKSMQGKAEELKQALLKLIPISRKAPGCLQYDLLASIEQKEEFLVLMRWENLSDLRKHEASDYIAEFVRKYENVLYGDVQVTEWQEIVS